MNAQQYRALVNKLEAIQQLDELKIGDINPVTGKRIVGGMTDSEGNLVGSGTPGVYWNAKEEPVDTPTPPPTPEPPSPPPTPEPTPEPDAQPTTDPVVPDNPGEGGCDPETLAKIKYMPSFNQAFAAARKAGCETFQWCGVYRTKTPQGGKAKPMGWEANKGQNTAGGGAVGNTSITAQGKKAGATQVPDVPVQKASGYKLSPQEAKNVLANGQPNDIARYGGQAALQKIAAGA